MLFDPFEEEFDLPTTSVELRDRQRRHGEVVGQEDEGFAGFGVAIADAAHGDGIIVLGLQARHHDGLIKPQAGGFIHRPGVTAGATEILLGAGDEKRTTLMNPMPPGEVQVAAIHDVKRAGFPDELVEDVDIMHTASGDNDDGGKVALEGQQGMEFDGTLVFPKRGPRKQRETEVNGGGVQRVSSGLEFPAERFIRVERGGLLDEDLGEIGKDAPVPFFVGHRQSVAGGGLADAGVIELWAEGRQTGFDVAQTFAPGQLSEGQHEELFVSG